MAIHHNFPGNVRICHHDKVSLFKCIVLTVSERQNIYIARPEVVADYAHAHKLIIYLSANLPLQGGVVTLEDAATVLLDQHDETNVKYRSKSANLGLLQTAFCSKRVRSEEILQNGKANAKHFSQL